MPLSETSLETSEEMLGEPSQALEDGFEPP